MNHPKQNEKCANKDRDDKDEPYLDWLIPAAIGLFGAKQSSEARQSEFESFTADIIKSRRANIIFIESSSTIH